MAKSKESIRKTIHKEYPGFSEGVDGLSVNDLEKRLSTYAKEAEKVEDQKESDQELEQTRATLSELTAPYRDAKKAIRLKSKYIIGLIREKGGDA